MTQILARLDQLAGYFQGPSSDERNVESSVATWSIRPIPVLKIEPKLLLLILTPCCESLSRW